LKRREGEPEGSMVWQPAIPSNNIRGMSVTNIFDREWQFTFTRITG
jgi:hypothetical protein